MKRLSRFCSYAAALAAFFASAYVAATAQEPAKVPPGAGSGASTADELALSQSRLSDKYARLEELMFKMSTLEAASNPRRAALLTRAIGQSKEKLTKTQFDALVKMLNQQQLKRAIDGQAAVQGDLKSLLELLSSEDRSDRLKSEQARIKEYLKEVEKLIRLQKGLEGQNSPNGDLDRLVKQQQDLAGRTGKLAQTIKQNEEGEPANTEIVDEEPGEDHSVPVDDTKPKAHDTSEGGNEAPADSPQADKPTQSSDAENKSSPMPMNESGEPPAEENNASEGNDLEKNAAKPKEGAVEPMKGEPNSGKPSDSQPQDHPASDAPSSPMPSSDGQPQQSPAESGQSQPSQESGESQSSEPQPANPARERIEEAQKRMQNAQKQLEQAKRKESTEEQRAAREELEKAKAELEEILRQMREEEVKRTLAALKERFKRMLEMQLKVYESTRRLDHLPEENRSDQFIVDAGKLSFDERKIATEAFKALTLLQEEGSSVAFPASVEQMHDDMQQVTSRLGDAKVDDITVGIEEDIIASLEEMIDALQQAQQDLEEKEQQQQQQQQQGEQKQSLVDQIAELKMIKALQLRVNKRTTRYSRLLEDEQDQIGQASAAELVDALQKLSLRQHDIFQITRDIVIGKNK